MNCFNKLIINKANKIEVERNKIYNYKFTLLKSIAIFWVVCGHCSGGGISLFAENWFPYGLSHMAIFIFVSGYFYNSNQENNIWKAIWKKIKRLVIPYFVWNIIYGLICVLFRAVGLINYGDKFNLKSLFIRPWIDGHQFHFNIPAWFLLSLFIVSISVIIVRKILTKIHILNEWLLLFVFFIIGSFAIILSKEGYNSFGINMCFLRAAFLLPFFQLGYVYKMKLEKIKINNLIYFISIFIIQAVIYLLSDELGALVVFCKFTGQPWNIYLNIILSIAFWVKICELLAPATEKLKVVNYVGNNSFTIMMHHPIIIFAINTVIYGISKFLNISVFNVKLYKNTIWYVPLQGSKLAFFYVILALLVPCFIKFIMDKLILKRFLKLKSN